MIFKFLCDDMIQPFKRLLYNIIYACVYLTLVIVDVIRIRIWGRGTAVNAELEYHNINQVIVNSKSDFCEKPLETIISIWRSDGSIKRKTEL